MTHCGSRPKKGRPRPSALGAALPSEDVILLDGFRMLSECAVALPEQAVRASIAGLNIVDTVPADLAFFSHLMYLDAGENRISLEHLATLRSLEELHLHCNGLSDCRVPGGSFPVLRVLGLGYNALSQESLRSLALLPRLVELDLSFNDLETLPDEFVLLSCLVKLALRGNRLGSSGRDFLLLGCLPELRQLDISRNSFSWLPTGDQAIGVQLDFSDDVRSRYEESIGAVSMQSQSRSAAGGTPRGANQQILSRSNVAMETAGSQLSQPMPEANRKGGLAHEENRSEQLRAPNERPAVAGTDTIGDLKTSSLDRIDDANVSVGVSVEVKPRKKTRKDLAKQLAGDESHQRCTNSPTRTTFSAKEPNISLPARPHSARTSREELTTNPNRWSKSALLSYRVFTDSEDGAERKPEAQRQIRSAGICTQHLDKTAGSTAQPRPVRCNDSTKSFAHTSVDKGEAEEESRTEGRQNFASRSNLRTTSSGKSALETPLFRSMYEEEALASSSSPAVCQFRELVFLDIGYNHFQAEEDLLPLASLPRLEVVDARGSFFVRDPLNVVAYDYPALMDEFVERLGITMIVGDPKPTFMKDKSHLLRPSSSAASSARSRSSTSLALDLDQPLSFGGRPKSGSTDHSSKNSLPFDLLIAQEKEKPSDIEPVILDLLKTADELPPAFDTDLPINAEVTNAVQGLRRCLNTNLQYHTIRDTHPFMRTTACQKARVAQTQSKGESRFDYMSLVGTLDRANETQTPGVSASSLVSDEPSDLDPFLEAVIHSVPKPKLDAHPHPHSGGTSAEVLCSSRQEIGMDSTASNADAGATDGESERSQDRDTGNRKHIIPTSSGSLNTLRDYEKSLAKEAARKQQKSLFAKAAKMQLKSRQNRNSFGTLMTPTPSEIMRNRISVLSRCGPGGILGASGGGGGGVHSRAGTRGGAAKRQRAAEMQFRQYVQRATESRQKSLRSHHASAASLFSSTSGASRTLARIDPVKVLHEALVDANGSTEG